MTIEEMHIAVNLGVQKIASFQADGLLPEEIDYELNTAMRRFINQRYNPRGNKYQRGFEQSQKRLDDLRHLVEDYTTETHSFMGVGYTSKTNGNISSYRYKVPNDYMFLVNVMAEVTHDCRNKALPFTETNVYKDYLKISLTPPIPGYKIKSIQIANASGTPEAVISSPGGLSYDYLIGPYYGMGIVPSLSNNDSFTDRYFDTVATDSPPADGNELYLEKVYSGDEEGFIPISGASIENSGEEGGDATGYNGAYYIITWINPVDGEEVELVSSTAPTSTFIIKHTPVTTTQPEGVLRIYRTKCKFSQQDDIYALLDDPFNSTKPDSILYTIQETFVDLYTNTTFIPSYIQLRYIRKPASMTKRGGVGCELPEHTHHEIVEMAVKSILEGFESPRYNTQSREVLESE